MGIAIQDYTYIPDEWVDPVIQQQVLMSTGGAW